jgi:hypothetical protein
MANPATSSVAPASYASSCSTVSACMAAFTCGMLLPTRLPSAPHCGDALTLEYCMGSLHVCTSRTFISSSTYGSRSPVMSAKNRASLCTTIIDLSGVLVGSRCFSRITRASSIT